MAPVQWNKGRTLLLIVPGTRSPAIKFIPYRKLNSWTNPDR